MRKQFPEFPEFSQRGFLLLKAYYERGESSSMDKLLLQSCLKVSSDGNMITPFFWARTLSYINWN